MDFVHLGFRVQIVVGRGFQLVCRNVIVSHAYEIYCVVGLVDDLDRPHLHPGRIPFLCGDRIEMKVDAFVCKILDCLGVELSPGEEKVALPCGVGQLGREGVY